MGTNTEYDWQVILVESEHMARSEFVSLRDCTWIAMFK